MAYPSRRANIFISYSSNDKEYAERLQVHLQRYAQDGKIDAWEDARIRPGYDGLAEIKRAIAAAKVVILLTSFDFVNSERIKRVALPALYEAARQDRTLVTLRILISQCELPAELEKIQPINEPDERVARLNQALQDEIWEKVRKRVEEAFRTREEWRNDGRRFAQGGKYLEAKNAYNQAIQTAPNDYELHYEKAEAFYRHDPDEALLSHQKALKLNQARYTSLYRDKLMEALKTYDEEKVRYWRDALGPDHSALQDRDLWRSLLQASAKGNPTRFSWGFRAEMLKEWKSMPGPVTAQEISPWLSISWDELEAFRSLDLPTPWRKVALSRLIEQPPTTLTPKAVGILEEEYPLCESILTAIIKDRTNWSVATDFFEKLVKAGYAQKLPLLYALLPPAAQNPTITQALLETAQLTREEARDLIEQHSQALLAASQVPRKFASLIEQYLNQWLVAAPVRLSDTHSATLKRLRAHVDAYPQSLLASVISVFQQKLLDLIRAPQQADEERARDGWLQVLAGIAPPATSYAAWEKTLQLLAQHPFRDRDRRFWLLSQWAAMTPPPNAARVQRWLKIDWDEVDQFLGEQFPKEWQTAALIDLIEARANTLAPGQVYIIEQHSKDFESALVRLIQIPAKQDLTIAFFKKLRAFSYANSLSLLKGLIQVTLQQAPIIERLEAAAAFSTTEIITFLEDHSQALFKARVITPTFVNWLTVYLDVVEIGKLKQPATDRLLQQIAALGGGSASKELAALAALATSWLRIQDFLIQPRAEQVALEELVRAIGQLPATKTQEIQTQVVESFTRHPSQSDDDLRRVIKSLGPTFPAGSALAFFDLLIGALGEAYQRKRQLPKLYLVGNFPVTAFLPYIRVIYTDVYDLPQPASDEAAAHDLLKKLLQNTSDRDKDTITRAILTRGEDRYTTFWQTFRATIPQKSFVAKARDKSASMFFSDATLVLLILLVVIVIGIMIGTLIWWIHV